MELYIQTRSEMNGINYHSSMKAAMQAYHNDHTIWKISFSLGNNERIRLVMRNGQFVYEPLLEDK